MASNSSSTAHDFGSAASPMEPLPRAVTGGAVPQRARVKLDFTGIADVGFTVVRTYTPPPDDLVELAADWDLHLLAGVHPLDWRYAFGAVAPPMGASGAGLHRARSRRRTATRRRRAGVRPRDRQRDPRGRCPLGWSPPRGTSAGSCCGSSSGGGRSAARHLRHLPVHRIPRDADAGLRDMQCVPRAVRRLLRVRRTPATRCRGSTSRAGRARAAREHAVRTRAAKPHSSRISCVSRWSAAPPGRASSRGRTSGQSAETR